MRIRSCDPAHRREPRSRYGRDQQNPETFLTMLVRAVKHGTSMAAERKTFVFFQKGINWRSKLQVLESHLPKEYRVYSNNLLQWESVGKSSRLLFCPVCIGLPGASRVFIGLQIADRGTPMSGLKMRCTRGSTLQLPACGKWPKMDRALLHTLPGPPNSS